MGPKSHGQNPSHKGSLMEKNPKGNTAMGVASEITGIWGRRCLFGNGLYDGDEQSEID